MFEVVSIGTILVAVNVRFDPDYPSVKRIIAKTAGLAQAQSLMFG
jgi:hypothetical protein